jgi:hypothetical protein
MSIDQRLRTGLAANTQTLSPAVADELHLVLRRVRRRRRARIAGLALTAAAVAVAAIVWAPGALEGMQDRPLPADRTATPTPPSLSTLPEGSAIDPGRYTAEFPRVARPGALPLAVVLVPSGYKSAGSAGVFADAGGFRHIDLWTVSDVVEDPCSGPVYTDPGPSVRDLADALAALPVWESTKPKPITVGGYDGLVMDLNVPDPIPSSCGDPYLWRDDAGGNQAIGAGKHQRLWIVDVKGERVVILAGWFPAGGSDAGSGTTAAQAKELTDMAAGITFAAPPAPSP